MSRPPILRLSLDELVVDSFAGGGGASLGIEQALGRHVDIAINHDREALAMHAANHPRTRHYLQDVWAVDPVAACGNRKVGLMWLSPDCKHFSKAKGGKPAEKRIRGLAWVAVKWAKAVRPRVIFLENVEEFQDWGPLLEDGRPCPMRKGLTFRRFVRQLENCGYRVEYEELVAADYGAPTTRKRLFLIARCDGLPIVWPQPTHGFASSPWRTAAECIDWSLECPSIFDPRRRPLAPNTLRRIAAGIKRYVIDAPQPFIVPVCHSTSDRARSTQLPLWTVTTARGGEFALVAPTLIQTGYGERPGQAPRVPGLHKPLGTCVDGQKHALVTAFLAKHYGGPNGNFVVGQDMRTTMGTVTAIDHHAVAASTLVKLRHHSAGADLFGPLDTITSGGNHFAEVRAFLLKYYGTDQDPNLREPLHTLTTKDRFALVTVHGEQYAIADIGMRMLQPRELFRAQGFPDSYVIDRGVNGRILPKSSQVRMCGNSVCPPVARALVDAQFNQQAARRTA